LAAAVLLASCGGGGGGSTSSGSGGSTGGGGGGTTTTTTLTNYATVTVDQGPAALQSGPNGYTQSNVAYVTITLCAPGSTTNCQTIDHIQVDTGSVGLRVFNSVLNPSLLAAMTSETDNSNNPVGECFQYIDGYVFGSVKEADLTVGGEQVAGIPLQVLSDTGQFSNVPASCSAGGGNNLGTVQDFGSNGIIGIGVTTTDCGSACTANGGESAAIYYDCPASGCSSIIGRASNASAPFQQLPNPVAAMSVDNNGSSLVLPAVPSGGESTITGTLYFGIGTQTNNGLGTAKIYTTTGSNSPYGPGLITVDYKGYALTESFIDSGSSLYFFEDSTITPCPTSGGFDGLYCPSSGLSLSPAIVGQNGSQVSAPFTLYNAQTQFSTGDAAVPGVGGNPAVIFPNVDLSDSFDYGLPFFYGRTVYTAIEGRSAGGTTGPYFAF
jgi:hypothetical protein